MKHNYHPVSTVFSEQCCFVVPLFQRPYVWTEDEQWRPLWDDIRRVTDDVLSPPTRIGYEQPRIRPHFLGSVVLEQVPTSTGHVNRREIIDGQQRLTTLQIFLKAARDAADEAGAMTYAGQFEDMIWNRYVPPTDPNGEFKVWPTDADQRPYQAVMRAKNGAVSDKYAEHTLAGAYRFFRRCLGDWIGSDPDKAVKRADALSIALRQHIRLMVLDCEPGEDAQVIFETLNARGTPLLPLDLVKNWLLREADRNNANPRQLYDDYWRETFDHEIEYWREEVGRGHAQKPRADLFLQNFLAIRMRDEVTVGHLFYRFMQDVEANPEDGVGIRFAKLESNAKLFREIDEPDEDTLVGRRLARLKELDVVTVYPFLMATLPRVDEQAMLKVLEFIESYLVRRLVCGLNTRGYGRFFIGLASEVNDTVETDSILTHVAEFLAKSDADAARWPNDEELKQAWSALQAYKKLARSSTRFILGAIEERMRTQDNFGEPFVMPPKLEIEHVMPRQWNPNWPLLNDQANSREAIERRDALIHTFGNLTLVTSKLNKTLSNAPWAKTEGATPSKRETLQRKSLTKLRDGIIFPEGADWTEERIVDRTHALFDWARRIWPVPPAAQV